MQRVVLVKTNASITFMIQKWHLLRVCNCDSHLMAYSIY